VTGRTWSAGQEPDLAVRSRGEDWAVFLRTVGQLHGFPVDSVIRDAVDLVYDDPPS
jgi:hypothetical protein